MLRFRESVLQFTLPHRKAIVVGESDYYFLMKQKILPFTRQDFL